MPDFLSFINEILWGSVMIYLLLGAGIWFSWQTRGIQFRYVRKFGRSLKKSLHPQPGGTNHISRSRSYVDQGMIAAFLPVYRVGRTVILR